MLSRNYCVSRFRLMVVAMRLSEPTSSGLQSEVQFARLGAVPPHQGPTGERRGHTLTRFRKPSRECVQMLTFFAGVLVGLSIGGALSRVLKAEGLI
jgi:hypothetical protein